tara:strand:- start:828 stop:1466 length:639 start_codon:yes stop_codon:yes gene_type:complete
LKIRNVIDLQDALNQSLSLIPNKKRLNISLTGGNFGEKFLNFLLSKNKIQNEWEIFLSDERLYPGKSERLSDLYLEQLKNYKDISHDIFHFFDTNCEPDTSYNKIEKFMRDKRIFKLDVCFLSLGEDGHLAGHFRESVKLKNKMFCYTDNAPKLPKDRVSFDLSWLAQSSQLVLIALGLKKEKALMEFIEGKGMHSNLRYIKNVTVITDLDI